ncbi:hypothetical protein GCM10022393_00590 [Aquimarina addita]|uniref:Uncharacterized protein n=1 Tax=Aquimarina addita TaxID=870485 RepID=A0ABP7X7E8_9FLAO
MKKFVIILLLTTANVYSQNHKEGNPPLNSESIFILLDRKDELILIENDRDVFLFLDKQGLNAKKSQDSIYKKLKSPYELTKNGHLIVKDQPFIDPWLQFTLSSKVKSIEASKLDNYDLKNGIEFIKSHSKYIDKFAVIKNSVDSCYHIYKIYIHAIE